jgi:hypothetical protein
MRERSSLEDAMSAGSGLQRPCRTCDRPWASEEFYEGCSECKACKRDRSRRNRAAQARKIAAFERFVDVLIVLADRAGEPTDENTRKEVA